MRVLGVGSDKVYAIENFYVKYLREYEADIKLFTAQSIFYDYYQRSIINKIIFKIGFSGILNTINDQFKKEVLEFKPEIILVFKGMEIYPESLRWAKSKGIKLVNYNPDNPFIFTGKGSGNKNVTNSIGLYDLHLTYDNDIRERMITEYGIPTGILPFGFEISDELYAECIKHQEIVKTCFLGNPDEQRAAFILQLAGHMPIDVYGNNWEKFVSHKNITVHEPVYGKDLWITLYRYRVQLNMMRTHNPGSHNMRSFEVPGIGGIGLFPKTRDHATYFENGKEIFLYSDIEECVKQGKALLSLNSDDANKIRLSARLKSLHAGYSYRDRAHQVLQELKQLI
jgi:spore maturation protein CgeB